MPRLPGVDFPITKRLEKLKNRSEPKDDNDNFDLLPPPSPPQPPSVASQSPRPPLEPNFFHHHQEDF